MNSRIHSCFGTACSRVAMCMSELSSDSVIVFYCCLFIVGLPTDPQLVTRTLASGKNSCRLLQLSWLPRASSIHPIPSQDQYSAVLVEFPDILCSRGTDQLAQHTITHHICTTGPLVSARPRRLPLDCLRLVKEEFDHMLDLGIVQPSSNFILQFTTDIRYIAGSANAAADALSCIVFANIQTSTTAIDFAAMARAQQEDLAKSTALPSLTLRATPLPTADVTLLCDISHGTPRPYHASGFSSHCL